jgi:acetolactate decarboxylase
MIQLLCLIVILSSKVEIKIQPIEQLTLDLPHSIDYLTASLDDDISDDLDKAEH